MPRKMWDELYNGYNYLPMLGLKLNHFSRRGPRMLVHFFNLFCNSQSVSLTWWRMVVLLIWILFTHAYTFDNIWKEIYVK